MAETARRTGHGHGSDVVRRLIARPIRMQATRPAEPSAGESPFPDAGLRAGPSEAIEAADIAQSAPPPDADRLRTEMLLLKAVLQAERRENASLRACLGVDEADAALGTEARAMRDRWAALVDRLLHATA